MLCLNFERRLLFQRRDFARGGFRFAFFVCGFSTRHVALSTGPRSRNHVERQIRDLNGTLPREETREKNNNARQKSFRRRTPHPQFIP